MSTKPYPQQSYPMETYPEYRQPPTQPPRPPKKELSKNLVVVIVVLVVTIVILAFSLYLVLLPSVEVSVRVHNDTQYSIEYDLYVDGKPVLNDKPIPVNSYDVQKIRVGLSAGGCERHEFFITATESPPEDLGWSRTDVKNETLCTGQVAIVDFYFSD